MKKLLFIVFLTILNLSAYEINFNKNFSKSVTPDLLTTYINVIVEKKSERDVNLEIEKFNNYIKDNDLVKFKDGRYTLSPRYNYVNNKQKFLGYSGNLHYKVETKNAKNINEFVSELINIKERINSDDVKLNISNINWEIGEELYNKSLDDLRFEVVSWVNSYAVDLSSKLGKFCEVSKININSVNRGNVYYARDAVLATSMKASAEIAPSNADENININPNFVLECK